MLQILLAEDNVGDILLVQEALQEHKIDGELHVVHDGEAALDFIANMGGLAGPPCPNLVLLDLNMPKIDGPEFLAALRRHPECADVPVIVVTSSNSLKDQSQMAELGISSYFVKPCDFDAFLQLGALVRQVLERNVKVSGAS